jgi:hypothetical protein
VQVNSPNEISFPFAASCSSSFCNSSRKDTFNTLYAGPVWMIKITERKRKQA